MSHLALADFLDELDRERSLVRITAEVDANLELSAVTQRVARSSDSPALLFAQVKGQEFPLATNLLGSEPRICRALGAASLTAVHEQLKQLLHSNSSGWLESLRLLPQGGAKWAPRMVKNGACQQVVRLGSDIDLTSLIATRWWPEDSSPAIPSAVTYVQAKDDAWRSMELCSVALLDAQRLVIGWEPHRRLAGRWQEAIRSGEQIPLAVALGGHPLDALCAAAPLGAEADRWTLSGLLRQRPCELVRCRTVPVDVPSDAEVVVEGYLDPTAAMPQDVRQSSATGYYGGGAYRAVFQATCVTHRANPIQTAIAPNRLPNELTALRAAMLTALKPLVLATAPEIADFHLPQWAGARHLAIVAIRKTRPHQARQTAGMLWSLEPWMFARLLVLVDEDADVQDIPGVLQRITANCDPECDVFQQRAAAEEGSALPLVPGTVTLLGIDATRKIPGEQKIAAAELRMSSAIEELVSRRWAEYGLPPLSES